MCHCTCKFVFVLIVFFFTKLITFYEFYSLENFSLLPHAVNYPYFITIFCHYMKVEILSAEINSVAQAVQATSIVDVGAGQVFLTIILVDFVVFSFLSNDRLLCTLNIRVTFLKY